jgi:hypothetical protein
MALGINSPGRLLSDNLTSRSSREENAIGNSDEENNNRNIKSLFTDERGRLWVALASYYIGGGGSSDDEFLTLKSRKKNKNNINSLSSNYMNAINTSDNILALNIERARFALLKGMEDVTTVKVFILFIVFLF